MTSFIAARGSGRSTSFIPAVPAARSVTTIAFIVHLPVWSLLSTCDGGFKYDSPGDEALNSVDRNAARTLNLSCRLHMR
jgi:hypothetical protein